MTARSSLAVEFGSLMRETDRLARATLDQRLAPMGLSGAQWGPLLALHRRRGEPQNQTELARLLGIEAPTLVRLLDRLAAKGWIERRPCPGDRRARLIALTPRAFSLCADIEQAVAEAREHWLRDVADEELEHCNAVLRRIRARMQPPGA